LQFILSVSSDKLKAVKLPVTSLFQNWDGGYPVQELGLIHKITMIKYTSYFALLSAAAHLAVLLFWDTYTSQLARGLNRFRWVEYSLSSSLIITLLFMLFGNFDFV